MIKKFLLGTGILLLRNTVFARDIQGKVFLKDDLETALKKHLVCIHDSLEKIITKDKIAKLDESFYDLNNVIERYNFISEKRNYINYEMCDKYSTYVITILENMKVDEKDIEDWKTGYTFSVISSEIGDITNHKKGKEYKNEFSKSRKNNDIEKQINKYYDVVLEEDSKNEKKKDITSDRNIFKD